MTRASARTLGGRWRGSARVVDVPRRILLPIIVPAVFVAVWWFVAAAQVFPNALLPDPLAVFSALVEWLFGFSIVGNPADAYAGRWVASVVQSATRVLTGYAIGAALGIAIGGMMGWFPLVRQTVEPFINVLRAVPIIGWVPLALVFFGLGAGSAIFVVALGVFFPVAVSTMSSVYGVQPSLIRVGQMVGASQFQLLRRIVLPYALPGIIIGLRVALGFAWILVIVAEWVGVREGLGFTLLDAYNFIRFDYVIAAMISVGFVGFVSDRLISLASRPALRWYRETTIGG